MVLTECSMLLGAELLTNESQMKVLVVGGSGFVASKLLASMAGSHHELVTTTRGSATSFPSSPQLDLSQDGLFEGLPLDIDVVVHLAQSRRYREFPSSAIEVANVNVLGTSRLLDWARRSGVAHFILASSGSVYKESMNAVREDSEVSPSSFYATTKRSAEDMVRQYSPYFQTSILRIFNVFGPGQRETLFPRLVSSMSTNQAITINSDGGPYLSPTYVDDVCNIIATLIESSSGRGSTLLNVAGPESLSLAEASKRIAVRVGLSPIFKVTDSASPSFVADTSLLESFMPNLPRVTFDQGTLLCEQDWRQLAKP